MDDKTEHTAEPWRVDANMQSGAYIRAKDGDLVCSCYHMDGTQGMPAIANARRIVACVNACKGLDIDALEAGGEGWLCQYLDESSGEISAARAIADDAVRLLQQLAETIDSGNVQMSSAEIDPGDPEIPPHPWHEEWLSSVRAFLDRERKP